MAFTNLVALDSVPRRMADTDDRHARRNFTGDDLATTLAVRNGFSTALPDGSFQSICGSCGETASIPRWGEDCHKCRRLSVDPLYDDQRRENLRKELGME